MVGERCILGMFLVPRTEIYSVGRSCFTRSTLAIASSSAGSVRSRAKMRQSHKGWCLMDVGEPLHLVGWRET